MWISIQSLTRTSEYEDELFDFFAIELPNGDADLQLGLMTDCAKISINEISTDFLPNC